MPRAISGRGRGRGRGIGGAVRADPAIDAVAVAVSLHATSPNQAGDVQNRYDVIASAQFRAT